MTKIDPVLPQALQSMQRPKPAGERPEEQASPPKPADGLSLTQTVKASGPSVLPPSLKGLTTEELGLVSEGLLSPVYAELKEIATTQGTDAAKAAYRKGKEGPFDGPFGDPGDMLNRARQVRSNPEWTRLAKDLQPGDILVETQNKPDDAITNLTSGPFIHARICVSASPPEFIEAVGITGRSGDPSNNRVRWSGMPVSDNLSVRVMRPTEGMEEPQKSRAIQKAIRYAEEQLGKPYDYSYTNENRGQGLTDAYYCSELAYLAYASPEGANLNLPLSKSTERDELVVALNDVVDALEPKDKAALMDQALKVFTRNPKPTGAEMVAFLVDNVMTKCTATENLTDSPEDREKLKTTILALMEGKAFPNLHQAIAEFNAGEAKGEYDAPVIGWAREQKNRLDIGTGLASDLGNLIGTSGLDMGESVKTAWKVADALLPHSEVLASFMFGPKDGRTKSVGQVLDSLDWLKKHVPDLPVIGDLGLGNLPERARPSLKTDFVSPTDLAWANIPHDDYNVKKEFPIDQAGYEAMASTVNG